MFSPSNLKIVFCAAAAPPPLSRIVPPPQKQIRSDLIGLCKVPKEVSRRAGFNGAHNFGVSTPPGGEN